MVNSYSEKTTEMKNSEDTVMEDDDISEKTAQTGAKVDYIAKEMRELTLRFEFVVKNKEEYQLTMIRHIEVMRAIGECGDMSDIIVYDNKNNKVSDFYDQKWIHCSMRIAPGGPVCVYYIRGVQYLRTRDISVTLEHLSLFYHDALPPVCVIYVHPDRFLVF